MKKGFYFIVASQEDRNGVYRNLPLLQEGSYELKGKLFIHRKIEDSWCSRGWKVSHIQSGGSISADLSLSQARKVAKDLQHFTLWDIEKYEDLKDAIQNKPEYSNEVKQIQLLKR